MLDRDAERLLQLRLADGGIGGEEAKHRRHVRVDHAGAFGDAADAHLAPGDGELDRDLLGKSVAGHDRLGGAGDPSVEESCGASWRIDSSIFSMGSGTPMRPVEQTITCRSRSPSAAAAARGHALGALDPLHAGAGVGVAGVGHDRAHVRGAQVRRETRTGAALTLFVVKVPATTAGVGEWISAMSGLLAFAALMPQ